MRIQVASTNVDFDLSHTPTAIRSRRHHNTT